MSLIVLSVVVYVGLYVVLSIPTVQQKVRERVSKELSSLLGGRLDIESLTLTPFSEVKLSGVTLDSPDEERIASIAKVAAGIDLWALFYDHRIVLNYAEIIGLDADIIQKTEKSPLNIQFLIDALSPKDNNKPTTLFDLKIRNIVVRDSRASFLRPWMIDDNGFKQRFADVAVNRLRMDLSIPVLRNNQFQFDIRNIQFETTPGLSVRGLSAHVSFEKDTVDYKPDRLAVKDFKIRFPKSSLDVGDIELELPSIDMLEAKIKGSLTPSDFSSLLPQLEAFDTPWEMTLDALMNGKSISLAEFKLANDELDSKCILRGNLADYSSKDSLNVELKELKADISSRLTEKAIALIPKINEKGKQILLSVGKIGLELEGNLQAGDRGAVNGVLSSEIGGIEFNTTVENLHSKSPRFKCQAKAEEIECNKLLDTDKIGLVSFEVDADVAGFDRNAEGHVMLNSDELEVSGNVLTEVELNLNKRRDHIDLTLDAASKSMSLSLDGNADFAGVSTRMDAGMTLSGFNPSDFGIKGKMADCEISCKLAASTIGSNANNITGIIDLRDLSINKTNGSKLNLSNLTIAIDTLRNDEEYHGKMLNRDLRINCDWIDGHVSGYFNPTSLVSELKGMVGSVFPTLIPETLKTPVTPHLDNDFVFDFNVKDASDPYVFFNTPVRPLTDIPICGLIDAPHGKAKLTVSTPHLQQGKNNLIRDVDIKADLDAFLGMAKVNAGLIYPTKKGDAELSADIYALRDKVNVELDINPTLKSVVKGEVALGASFFRLPDPYNPRGILAVRLDIHPSIINVNDKAWMIADGGVDYSGKNVSISNFRISHDNQYIKIDGVASESADDILNVRLNDIDLEYIFNLLNINYVSFGGMASGELIGSKLLTKTPKAKTKYLRVKELSYNGAVLGDGDLASDYDARSQKVGIYAVIRDPLTRERKISVDGGIWVTRDSLSFGFDADKVNVGIMKPFVSAFCSDLYGEASGKCKLYGTFSDIDLVGALKADTLSMKLDFTNTWYHAGNDSVFLHKGVIDIPPLTLYDDEKHTAEFSGWLRHTYFHNPVFNFKLRDAKSLLCYNTNENINPLWYGTIYGSGHAQINGYPGLIDIDMNMTSEEGSKFYYVISEAEDVAQYSFLSFTDKRKEKRMEVVKDSVPDYLQKFRKQTDAMEEGSSNVVLSLKGTVTNDALVTLVMDPRAGDNITARGQGALQMDYNLASNDLRMIGTYVLDEGNYNFSLQDIIIKNFNIRKGSLIKFDGDPMKAILDITATYRVNTNLTDLDKSFSTDKELNRTNVPVDAVLLVDGPMTNPDITFDIELPSLTSDVERKVKSIVSTNDMMSRQIIYLLALNRFYTPEYTGGQSNGSEWSSMASSTISSQLSNILSQMTDKLDVAPSFRSEKGDFSDMEFDLALSSRLLNNRLLINGNFGYRDRSTSNTQFVGDFDIEYLLSKNGNLRLKAYNHFNDQNYYLRSALTTQGVGVVFRRDFDRLFNRRKKDENETCIQTNDSTSDNVNKDSNERNYTTTDN